MAERTNSLAKIEAIMPLTGALFLLVSCGLASSRRYFEIDELFTFYLATDPSLTHMLKALADQVDTSPPLYFILAWLWVKVWGSSEISLRLFSSLGMSLAFVMTWLVLRRTFGLWPASLGAAASFSLSLLIFQHNAEARFYGLFLGLAALALWQYHKAARREFACSPKDFLANAAIHGSLVLTHNFGFLYSAIFLLAQLMAAARQRVVPLPASLSILAGWLFFLPWLSPFLHQAKVGSPRSGIPMPTKMDLLASFGHSILISFFLVLLVLMLGVFMVSRSRRSEPAASPKPASSPGTGFSVLLLGLLLVVMPPLIAWLFSRLFFSIFQARYMIPSTLGWSILFAYLLYNCLPVTGEPREGKKTLRELVGRNHQTLILSIFWFIFLLFLPIFSFLKGFDHKPGSLEDHLYKDTPIVTHSANSYLTRFFYSPLKDRYIFLLDWDVALDKKNQTWAIDDYHTMAAFRRNYPYFNIMEGSRFLQQHHRFIILDDFKNFRWFELKIRPDPLFKFTRLSDTLILVERLPSK